MRYLFLLVTLVLISCGNDKKDLKTPEEGVTTYYLIRHAEKDRSTPNNPSLTAIGEKRATFWSTYFKNIPLDAVYSTNYNRTKETAAPTAKDKSLSVQLYSPDAMYDEAFQQATKGKTVLIVGHSNTTPVFVNTILEEKKYEHISDTENGMVYTVVIPENGEITVNLEKVEM